MNALIDKVYRVEHSDEVNTLIDEVNEEYPFWCPDQGEKHPDDSIHIHTKEEFHEDSIGIFSTLAAPTTTTATAPEIVSN